VLAYLLRNNYIKLIFKENDIAIIFLNEPLSIAGLEFPQLPDPDQTFDEDDADTMGWGDIKTGGRKINYSTFYIKIRRLKSFWYLFAAGSDDLLKAEMRTMTNEECIKKAPESEKEDIFPSHICAYGRAEADSESGLEDDSCQVTLTSITKISEKTK